MREDYHILQHLGQFYILAIQLLSLFPSRQLNPQAWGGKVIYRWVHQNLMRASLSFNCTRESGYIMCEVEFIPPESDKGIDERLKIAENQVLEVRIRHWAGYKQFSAVAPPAHQAQLLWILYLSIWQSKFTKLTTRHQPKI